MARILIIEDDDAIALIERDYLEINDYEVTICKDGESGMQKALSESYDLILLDLMLPGVDGFTLCRKLREQLDIPIIMVTARHDDVDKIRGLGLGADDYVEKPFSPSVLVARVKAHLAQFERISRHHVTQTTLSTTTLQCGDIVLNPITHRVYIKGKEQNLKNKEYELLLFFMQNIDIVFSREILYERIWGMNALGDNSTVSVHINRLREKIEEDVSNPRYIQTIWGAGYRFSSPTASNV